MLGLALLSPGLALMIYGLAQSTSAGGFGAPEVWGPALTGVVAARGFVWHALRTPQPLIDLRLFANRTFAAASGTLILMIISVFGAMLLLPLYLQAVRGESAFDSGLLLAPQGIGAMLVMPIAGRLTDKTGVGKIVIPGLIILGLSTLGADPALGRHVLLGAQRRPVRDGRRHGLLDDAADVGRDADAAQTRRSRAPRRR